MAGHTSRNKTKPHKPPSRLRYEQSHPTMSCRLDKDTYTLLKQRLEDLGGISLAAFVKNSLGLLELKTPDIEEIREEAEEEAYLEAEKAWQTWYYCAVCHERINIEPNSNEHKTIIDYMRKAGWRHIDCHNPKLHTKSVKHL